MNELERRERRTARILVAFSATAETRVELDVYRYLLGETPPEIVGLVVEEPALLAHAGSRLAREIVMSGLERRLDRAALERELRARATVWRRVLETESARLGLTIALETVRDERRAALARAAERADALVVETAALQDALEIWSALTPGAPLRTLVMTPGRRLAGGIVVVTDGTEPDDEAGSARAAAMRLARRTGAAVTVIDVAPPAGARIDASTLAALAARAALLVLPEAVSRDAPLVTELAARFRGALVLVRRVKPADRRR